MSSEFGEIYRNSELKTPNSELRREADAKGLQKMGVGVDQGKGSFRCADETVYIDAGGRPCGQPFVSQKCGRAEKGSPLRKEKKNSVLDFREGDKFSGEG